MITAQISIFAFYAARFILFILIILSILTIGFFIERIIFYKNNLLPNNKSILPLLENTKTVSEIEKILIKEKSRETKVILKALSNSQANTTEFEKKISAYLLTEKEEWDRFSLFLGSVGSNAPFIGLLGTVLGILKSFADLGISAKGGPTVVMAGISEALVVTAVGLAVAIPAVLFFNICKSKVRKASIKVESIVDLISSKNLFTE